MAGRLVDQRELAFWHEQAGAQASLFDPDRVWNIGDRSGAVVGSVFLDGELFDLPDYWVRDDAGLPAIGLQHADGILASVSDPWHRIVWADGTVVGFFRDAFVHWRDQPVAKWQVEVGRTGRTVTLDGAWLWDPSDAVVASVTNVVVPGAGAHLTLTREAELDECLEWAALALPLVAFEHYRRARVSAQQQRQRLRRRHRH